MNLNSYTTSSYSLISLFQFEASRTIKLSKLNNFITYQNGLIGWNRNGIGHNFARIFIEGHQKYVGEAWGCRSVVVVGAIVKSVES